RWETYGAAAVEMMIDVKQAGERDVDKAAARLRAGDSLLTDGRLADRLPDQGFGFATARIAQHANALAAPASGTASEQAVFLIEMEVENPFAWAMSAQ